MKPFYIIPMILIALPVKGADRVEKSFDLNSDGKIDFVEVTLNKILIERKEDLNNDGTFDRQTLFYPETSHEFFKVVEEKKHGTHPGKRISYWHDPVKKKTFSLTQIDENNDGKWDKEFRSSSEIVQHKDECSEEDALATLARTATEAASLSDEYYQTSWGHQIHKSCLENNNKDWFLENTEKAIKGGMACLDRLGKSGGTGAQKNHISLDNILQQKNVQVICNENSYDWGSSTLAYATTSSDNKNSLLKHPGISLNPTTAGNYKRQGKQGDNEFVRTMFHEQLHNLGYLHGHDIEYPYACEKCCFPESSDSADKTSIACNVCSGNYSGSTDVNYLRDITSFGISNYNTSHGISTSIKYLMTRPGDVSGLSYLALNLSGIFDPVGVHLAAKIRASDKPDASQVKILDEAQNYEASDIFKPYEASSRIVADAFYESFRSQNPASALALLKKEATLIKRELSQKPKEEDSRYVAESVKAGIKKLVYTVWLDGYSGKSNDPALKKQLDTEAYDLVKLFNL